MILEALKSLYPNASEKVLMAVKEDLEKLRGKQISTVELVDWMDKLVVAHTINEALRTIQNRPVSAMSRPLFMRRAVMKSMIDELWYGNVSPMDDTRNNTEEMKELMSCIARHQEELMATLTDKQKAIFEKFDDCWSEYSNRAQKAIFSYAFKLGARLVLETLTD